MAPLSFAALCIAALQELDDLKQAIVERKAILKAHVVLPTCCLPNCAYIAMGGLVMREPGCQEQGMSGGQQNKDEEALLSAVLCYTLYDSTEFSQSSNSACQHAGPL